MLTKFLHPPPTTCASTPSSRLPCKIKFRQVTVEAVQPPREATVSIPSCISVQPADLFASSMLRPSHWCSSSKSIILVHNPSSSLAAIDTHIAAMEARPVALSGPDAHQVSPASQYDCMTGTKGWQSATLFLTNTPFVVALPTWNVSVVLKARSAYWMAAMTLVAYQSLLRIVRS